jgi:hypothetical protein
VRRGSRIKARFGLKAGFDYVVAEKSLVFTSAAADHPEFARELPRFVSEVRRMVTPDEISIHIARVEQRAKEANAAEDDDELYRENPAPAAGQAGQSSIIKELLTAPELGTS